MPPAATAMAEASAPAAEGTPRLASPTTRIDVHFYDCHATPSYAINDAIFIDAAISRRMRAARPITHIYMTFFYAMPATTNTIVSATPK